MTFPRKRSFSSDTSSDDLNSPEPCGIPATYFPEQKRRKIQAKKDEQRFAICARSQSSEEECDIWETEGLMPNDDMWKTEGLATVKPKAQRFPLGALFSTWKVQEYEILSASSSFNACFICALSHAVKKDGLSVRSVCFFLERCATYLEMTHKDSTSELVEKIRNFCKLEGAKSLPHDLWSPHYLKLAAAAVMETDVYIINGHNLQEGPLKLDDTVLVEKFGKNGTHSVLTFRKLTSLKGDNRVLFWPQMSSNHWYFVKLKYKKEVKDKVSSNPQYVEDSWGEDLF